MTFANKLFLYVGMVCILDIIYSVNALLMFLLCYHCCEVFFNQFLPRTVNYKNITTNHQEAHTFQDFVMLINIRPSTQLFWVSLLIGGESIISRAYLI